MTSRSAGLPLRAAFVRIRSLSQSLDRALTSFEFLRLSPPATGPSVPQHLLALHRTAAPLTGGGRLSQRRAQYDRRTMGRQCVVRHKEVDQPPRSQLFPVVWAMPVQGLARYV